MSEEACAGALCGGSGLPTLTSRNFNDKIFLSSNTLYSVELFADADSTDTSGQGITLARALADPFIEIDTSFLADHPGLSLEFSDGIVNAPISAVPLPPALSMFGAALLALGAFAWRRRSQA